MTWRAVSVRPYETGVPVIDEELFVAFFLFGVRKAVNPST
jgi:hypothetical protein